MQRFQQSDICTSYLSNNFSLSNCVTTTTRKIAILDLILVSDNLIDSISECLVGPPISSDHISILMVPKTNSVKLTTNVVIHRDFNKTNIRLYNE